MGDVEGVCRLVSDDVKHRMENARPALHVLEFLENMLPDEKLKDLVFAINLAEVKRESLNPDNPYFAHLSSRKKELLGVFPTTEEYQRLHKEKMENLHKRREAQLQKIREAANEIATTETWEKMGERLLTALEPIVEAYFNPRQD
jgi:molecular chaperone GrpE (heat shock protein)